MYDYHISLLFNTREYIILSFKLYFTFIFVSFHFNFHPTNVSLVNEFFYSCYNKGSLLCVCCIGMYISHRNDVHILYGCALFWKWPWPCHHFHMPALMFRFYCIFSLWYQHLLVYFCVYKLCGVCCLLYVCKLLMLCFSVCTTTLNFFIDIYYKC